MLTTIGDSISSSISFFGSAYQGDLGLPATLVTAAVSTIPGIVASRLCESPYQWKLPIGINAVAAWALGHRWSMPQLALVSMIGLLFIQRQEILIRACSERHSLWTRLASWLGAEIDYPIEQGHMTLISRAIENDNQDDIDFLIRHGANYDSYLDAIISEKDPDFAYKYSCEISYCIPKDPVCECVDTGSEIKINIYDRTFIKQALENSNQSPASTLPLKMEDLQPLKALKAYIDHVRNGIKKNGLNFQPDPKLKKAVETEYENLKLKEVV